jgi:hypothetical protein
MPFAPVFMEQEKNNGRSKTQDFAHEARFPPVA